MPFSFGDVFASHNNGDVQHYDGAGNLLETLNTGQFGFTTGCAFDSSGNLYVTNFSSNSVSKFDGPGDPHTTSLFGGAFINPESIVFDGAGNAWVSSACCGNIERVDSSGNHTLSLNTGGRADWIDLNVGPTKIFFTEDAVKHVAILDVASNTRDPDFNGSLGNFALRIRPDGGILVANREDIKRLDATGADVQTYDVTGQDLWFALNLDPDGTSFWSGDFGNDTFFKFDIASGTVLLGPISTGTFGGNLFGLCVFGERTVGRETNCTDGIDNDRDGLIDCADPDCALDPACAATTTTTTTTTTSTTTSTTTTTTSTTTTTAPVTGYMTGGGEESTSTGLLVTFNGGTQRGVTQGLLLHCRAATLPNNLQVNWAKNSFHLQQLVSATCSNDGMNPKPPPAGFDVLQGSGTGRCNRLAATANFKFADHGEPGTIDTVEIHITGGCSLDVSGNLQGGDIQAHN